MMVSLSLTAGGQISIPTSEEITDQFGALHDHIGRVNTKARPLFRNLISSVAVSASGTTVLSIPQRPATGRMWNILNVGLLGTDGHTPISSTEVEFYCGNSAEPDMSSMVWSATVLPTFQWFPKHAIWLSGLGEIYSIVYGSPTIPAFTLVARVMEFPDSSVEATSIPSGGVC